MATLTQEQISAIEEKRRLKKFLANASSEEMAFYKMMQDDDYECDDAEKLISFMKNDQRKQEKS